MLVGTIPWLDETCAKAETASQAAFDALTLGEWMNGNMGKENYDSRLMQYAQSVQQHGVMLGERSQFGRHPLAG